MHPDLRPFLWRIAIRNFKSIGSCEVLLKPRTLLVGRNGAGKSNFLDAIHFVAEGLQSSLDQAISTRGGIDFLHGRRPGRSNAIAIRLDYTLPYQQWASYALELTSHSHDDFEVSLERLVVHDSSGRIQAQFHRSGSLIKLARTALDDQPVMPPLRENRLYLVNAAGLPEFRPAYDALASMGFYKLNPEAMKGVQTPSPDEILRSDGSNIASVIGRLALRNPETMERINRYLESIVPGIESVERETLGPRETLLFTQRVEHAPPTRFYPASMSDGTLRALGILVATTQTGNGSPIRLVGIEEPETALHPAAAGALMDALHEATSHTQVIITTHSADLLDQVSIDRDGLLVVISDHGNTTIAPIDEASLSAVREHLFSAGELLRSDQFEPDRQSVEKQAKLDVFDSDAKAS